MATEEQRSRRWRFTLRGLLVAVLLMAVLMFIGGTGLFMHWWFAPFVVTHYHNNGRVANETVFKRDWRGGQYEVLTTLYYSNGRKSYESGPFGRTKQYWLPDGTSLPADGSNSGPPGWREAAASDDGNGTVRLTPSPESAVE